MKSKKIDNKKKTARVSVMRDSESIEKDSMTSSSMESSPGIDITTETNILEQLNDQIHPDL